MGKLNKGILNFWSRPSSRPVRSKTSVDIFLSSSQVNGNPSLMQLILSNCLLLKIYIVRVSIDDKVRLGTGDNINLIPVKSP